MRLIVCTIAMIIGGAWAHYYRSYSERDTVFPKKRIWSEEFKRHVDYVRCPVCEARYPISGLKEGISDECPENYQILVVDGVTYMGCKNDSFLNKKCGQWDCYRVDGDKCSNKQIEDVWGRSCAPGYFCNGQTHKCEGPGGSPTSMMAFYRDGALRSQLDPEQRERSAFNLDDLIRLRRQA